MRRSSGGSQISFMGDPQPSCWLETEPPTGKWINHEILETWNEGKGIVGVRIHGLKNLAGSTSTAGSNPFDYVSVGAGTNKKKLSSVVKLYDPTVFLDSKATYKKIADNLEAWVEEAIKIRNSQ